MAALKARQIEIDRQNYTIDEFERMPEYSGGYELIDGRIIKKPMPGGQHSIIADNLLFAFRQLDPKWQKGTALREVTIKMADDTGNGREPDLCYITSERMPEITPYSLDVVPDLVIEVWSPNDVKGDVVLNSTRIKMLYWPNHGVKVTWCINPKAETVEILYAGDKVPSKTLRVSDTLDGENIMPGFTMPVADLFA